MPPTHVLVDLENNQPTLDDVKRLVPEVTHAWLFHSRGQVKRLASFAPLGAEQTPVPISRPGKNALDFHLAFYVGYIASRNPGARIVIVAIDRGYRPMIEHAVSLGFDVAQVPFKPGVAPAKKAAGKKAATRKPAAKPAKAGVAGAVKAAPAQAKAKAPAESAPKLQAAKRPQAKKPAAKAPARKTAAARARPAGDAVASATPALAPAADAAAKAVAAKRPRVAKAAAKKVSAVTRPAAKSPPKVAASPRTSGKPPAAEKVLATLRALGEKQPKRLRQLRRYVSSLLGTGEADPAVGRLVDHLVAIGFVRLSGEAVTYAPAPASQRG